MGRRRTGRSRQPTTPPRRPGGPIWLPSLLGAMAPVAFFLAMAFTPPSVRLSRATVAWACAVPVALLGLAGVWIEALCDRASDYRRRCEDYRESFYRMTWERNGIWRELRRWKAAALDRGAVRHALPTGLAAAREAKRRARTHRPEALAS